MPSCERVLQPPKGVTTHRLRTIDLVKFSRVSMYSDFRIQKRALNPMELDLLVVVSYPTRVLEAKLRSSTKKECNVHC